MLSLFAEVATIRNRSQRVNEKHSDYFYRTHFHAAFDCRRNALKIITQVGRLAEPQLLQECMTTMPGKSISKLKQAIFILLIMLIWWGVVFITGLYGWWMTPVAEPGDADSFFHHAKTAIDSNNKGNAALVLIEDGIVVHEYYSASNDPIDKDTVFFTASMSKWITAVATMKLVEEGKLNLDQPVSTMLSRWQLPNSAYDNNGVTVRRLLSHTAGLTDGLGFGDYLPEEAIPSVEEELSHPRASQEGDITISVGIEPGTEWKYSGGGYLILQLLIEEITGLPFTSYVSNEVFQPLDMTRSTYEFMGNLDNHAGSYDSHGKQAPLYQYASSAATGFISSSSDLKNFMLSQLNTTTRPRILSDASIKQMRVPHGSSAGFDIWGLGTILYAPTPDGDFVFGHDGANEPAINSAARINPSTNDAIIVLLTGHPSLATRIGSDWVLWQTGIPDVLDNSATFKSMLVPGLLGSLLVLALAFLANRRLSK